MSGAVHRTQLHAAHQKSAKMTVFAGFEMPLYFKDIAPEHLAVRNGVGVFDISHMGRVVVTGADAERFLNYVVTNDVSVLPADGAQYSVMCTEGGGIIDDFVLYRLEKERFLVVFNAGNRKKDHDWFVNHAEGFDVEISDVSDEVVMFAVQGPDAEKTLQNISTEDLSSIGRFKCGSTRLADVNVFLSRTGYTGEDGFEVFVWNASLEHPELAIKLWDAILDAGRDYGIEPCGLGARDTLRLEAGLCLYGNDIDETTTPIEAGLSFVVKLQKDEFIGKEVLQRQKAEGTQRKRVGVIMMDHGIPRPGFEVFSLANEQIGQLTSGSFSPLLKCGVGMGYVETSCAHADTVATVKIRGKMAQAKIVSFPLYDPEKYGYRRKKPGT